MHYSGSLERISFCGAGDSKYVDVGPFSLKLVQVLDLFTEHRVFLKIVGEGDPYTASPAPVNYAHVVLTINQQCKLI